jgi:hypothetical protein
MGGGGGLAGGAKFMRCQAAFDKCFMRAYACPCFEGLPGWFRVLLACVLNFCTGGVIYGWSALQEVYKGENVSANLCTANETLPCSAQVFQLGLIFSVASTGNMCAGLPMGVLVDVAGPRIAFFVSEVFVLTGAVLLTFASNAFDVYIPAFLIMGIGGTGVQVSLMHTSNLFPENKSNVTNAIHACFQLSFLIFALFQLLYDADPAVFRANSMFGVFSIFVLLSLIAGLFWPARAYLPAHLKARANSLHRNAPSPSIILPPGGFGGDSSNGSSNGSSSVRAPKASTYANQPPASTTTALLDDARIKELSEANYVPVDDGLSHSGDAEKQRDHEAGDKREDGQADGEEDDVFDEQDLVVVNTAGVMTNRTIATSHNRLVSRSIAMRDGDAAVAKGEIDPLTASFKEQILSGHLWACVFFVMIGIVFSNSFIATLGTSAEAGWGRGGGRWGDVKVSVVGGARGGCMWQRGLRPAVPGGWRVWRLWICRTPHTGCHARYTTVAGVPESARSSPSEQSYSRTLLSPRTIYHNNHDHAPIPTTTQQAITSAPKLCRATSLGRTSDPPSALTPPSSRCSTLPPWSSFRCSAW